MGNDGWRASVFCNGLATDEPRGCTKAESISTATDLCSRVTESTSRWLLLTSVRMPSRPSNGPDSILTLFPAARNGHGWCGAPAATRVCSARTSDSSTGAGPLLKPTICITPGVFKIGRRSCGSNRQNRYPGNSGTSTSLIRSDHRFRNRYSGRNFSNPCPWR